MWFAPSSPAAAEQPQNEAKQVVEKLHEALIDVMKHSGQLGYQGRLDNLTPVVQGSFDFPAIAKIIVGRYWGGLSDQDHQTFLDTFTRLSTATYASRFDSYGGESFRTLSVEPQPGGDILVKTELVQSDGTVVKLDYIVRPSDNGQWRILNVIADGVSDLSLKHADYTAVIKNEGYPALIARLNDKISKYAQPAGK
ncbi:MAG TPA: ABC transporter substrate-binding protein [Gammaproteobacteria bacterium]|nr:ABC transporter substrate-binding protein [Gammaproteobacteria bacterium]